MWRQFNLKVILKCLFNGIIMMFSGMIIQVAKGQLVFKKEPPTLSFVVGVMIAYIVMGFLFSIAFYIFKNNIPGKNVQQKSITHSLFCSFIVLVPGVIGMIAFDYDGLWNLLTPYKMEQYFIAVVDVVNFMIGGLVLAKLFKDDIQFSASIDFPKTAIVISGFIGTFLFPLLMFVFHGLAEMVIPLGLNIPGYARNWYYIGLLSPLILTGGLLPWFYHVVKESFHGSWLTKSIRFFLVFFICYWFMNFSFLVPFGFSVQTVLFYLIISVPSLLTVMILNGLILEKLGQGVVPVVKTNQQS